MRVVRTKGGFVAEFGVLLVCFLVGVGVSGLASTRRRVVALASACVVCAIAAGIVTGELAASPMFLIWDLMQGLTAGAAGVLVGGQLARRAES
jgi:hypothetical protein